MSTELTFYYDYLCPFANRLASLLSMLAQSGKLDMNICWKAFSLEQNNSTRGADFKYWEHSEAPSRGVRALAAAKAAANQGQAAFLIFHYALFDARHRQGKNIGDPGILMEIAEKAGLQVNRLNRDMADPACWQAVGKDHEDARENHNVFGVPTLIFPKGRPVYIKLSALPASLDEQLSLFHMIKNMAEDRPYLLELKRPDLKML
jgi:predicted DsbA family dithiol-disulfide isomerase